MAEYLLRIDQPLEKQVKEVSELPAGSIIRFDNEVLTPVKDEIAKLFIHAVLPLLPPSSAFVIDLNLSPALTALVGERLPEGRTLKVILPITPETGEAAVQHLGEDHLVWFSIDWKEQKHLMKNFPTVPITKIVKSGKPKLTFQFPAYLGEPASLAGVKALPSQSTLLLHADIEFALAKKMMEELRLGHAVAFASQMPAEMAEKLASLIPDGCCLKIYPSTQNAKHLISLLPPKCYVKFSSEFSADDKLELAQGHKMWKAESHSPFWQQKLKHKDKDKATIEIDRPAPLLTGSWSPLKKVK